MRRVAVTGVGAVTALGPDAASLDRGLRQGHSGIRELTLFDPSGYRSRLAAQAPDPAALQSFDDLSGASRPDRFGLQATLEAVRQAGLEPQELRRAACVFGTGSGGAIETEVYLRRFLGEGEDAADPALLVPHQPASVTDLVCRAFGIHGPRLTIMTACSSSATAIGYAGDLIRLGRADYAVAGGAEGLCRLTYSGFNALRALSPEPCRPFDVARKGISLGEGAAILVLEEAERARARGATILGYLVGFGITADAHHMTAPHPEGDGAARAMLAALADAGLSPEDIDYINAHGTGTPQNDAAETAAIRRVFGARTTRVPVSSTKSMVGHTLGAAGAVEAVVSLLSLRGGYLPPTAHLETPDPALDLDFIGPIPRTAQAETVLSSSFAFGGNNTVLVFQRD
ncbi:MAG TPA: beta-ketoacyl-[acyl-carrier-protein] synthase family protein [Polyangia bacterium]|nr:beta-ketoacyl-[acyl-carrier-protein] synthase family protein [Polyangia bacterium]